MHRKKIENAVDLAHQYATEIIPDVFYIKNMFNIIDPKEEYDKAVNLESIFEFTPDEANKVMQDQSVKGVIDKLLVNVTAGHIFELRLRCSQSNSEVTQLKQIKDKLSPSEYNEYEKSLIKEYKQTCTNMANRLEWFAMNFIENAADEKSVYGSLHQTFLPFVLKLYFLITRINDKQTIITSRYYQNIVKLYQLWCTRYRTHDAKTKEIDDETVKRTTDHDAKTERIISKAEKRIMDHDAKTRKIISKVEEQITGREKELDNLRIALKQKLTEELKRELKSAIE